MGLAVSTLSPPEQAQFQEISALLDADEADCLNKLLAIVSKEAVATSTTQRQITGIIAQWIRDNVFHSTKSFCDSLEEKIEGKRGGTP
jgi:hypothetical protein